MTPDNIDNDPANNRQKYAESNRQRMTPACQPQPEYIISELLLKRITMIMYQDCEPDVDIVDSLIAEVHARPHTSPPAPATFDLDDDRMYTSDEVKKAYTSGANAAREKVLKDIHEKQRKKWTLATKEVDAFFKDYEESLRAQQQGGVSE